MPKAALTLLAVDFELLLSAHLVFMLRFRAFSLADSASGARLSRIVCCNVSGTQRTRDVTLTGVRRAANATDLGLSGKAPTCAVHPDEHRPSSLPEALSVPHRIRKHRS